MAKTSERLKKEIKDLHLKKAELMVKFCDGEMDKHEMMYYMDRVDEDLGDIIQGVEDKDF